MAATVALGGGPAAPAGAAATTTVAIGDVVVNTASATVTGTLALGEDALAPFTISTDGRGDASPAGAGLDIGNTTVTPVPTSRKLVFKMQLHDGAALGGNAPATGYSWPIMADGDDGNLWWLGSGAQGTNISETARWVGLCNNRQGGWGCPLKLAGGVTADAVTWEIGLSSLAPAALGSVIESGSIFGATPRSFTWPSLFVFAGLAPADTATPANPYKIPGEVQVAIEPSTTPESQVLFDRTAQVDIRAGTFAAVVSVPTEAGSYTVWARSCWGDALAPTCATASRPLTI